MSSGELPREQDRRSRAFWDDVAGKEAHGQLHGLLERDARVATYRDRAESRVLYRRVPEVARARRILEVGCGGGRWTVRLAGHAERVVATDISARMVEHARARVAAAGRANVELRVAPFHELSFPGEAFDLVYLGSCLHYIDEPHIEEGLCRLDGMAAPGALLLSRDSVSTLGHAFHRSERYGGDDPAIYRPAAFYEQAMARHGWTLEDSWKSYATPLFWSLRKVLPGRALDALSGVEVWLAPLTIRWADLRRARGPKEHRFFVYRRRATR